MVSVFRSRIALPVALLSLFLPFIDGLPLIARNDLSRREYAVPLRILPLGDSITFGTQPDDDDKGTNGYRKQLRERLISDGAQVDFVGTQTSGDMADNQNEGHPGYTIKQLQGVMGAGLDLKPNAILLHIGTNDLNDAEDVAGPYDEAPQRLGELLDAILETSPDVALFVAKIIHSKKTDVDGRIVTYNSNIGAVVKERTDKGAHIAVVDESVVQASELADDLHPTNAGYAHMGDVWFTAVQDAANNGDIPAPA